MCFPHPFLYAKIKVEVAFQTLRVHGQDAVVLRFVLLATEDSQSGAGVDDVGLTPVAHSHHEEKEENALSQAVEAFKNLLDSIFKKRRKALKQPS